jgi:hypothetical protein
MTAPRISVREIEIFERAVVLRLPFRFGVITLRECPQTFARALVDVEGVGEAWGMSAEALAPKWFDKNPELSNDDNLDQLREALRIAGSAYVAADPSTAFGLFQGCYANQIVKGGEAGLPPLAAGYGQALLDRAVLDAVCVAGGTTLAEAIRGNIPGVTTAMTPELADFDLDGFLGGLAPLNKVAARHTVGMIDPLVASDQSADERLDDGLPETLEEVISAYGIRHFKIKITGDVDEDTEGLSRVAATLDTIPDAYEASIDGNEQYAGEAGVLELLSRLDGLASPALQRLLASTIYIEQPINRAVSLDTPVHGIAARAPLIIDESDGTLDAFPKHRPLGYSGVSSKTCKGFYKSILNAARCRQWSAEDGGKRYFLTGEDLTLQAGVALQQDLALISILGIDHAERNGHHYTHGMIAASPEEQARFLAAYPDLYRDLNGVTCARIENGAMSTAGVLAKPGWGSAVTPDWTRMIPAQSHRRAAA